MKRAIIALMFLSLIVFAPPTMGQVALPFSDSFEGYLLYVPPPPPWMHLGDPARVVGWPGHTGGNSVMVWGGSIRPRSAVVDLGMDYPDQITYEAYVKPNGIPCEVVIGFFEPIDDVAPLFNCLHINWFYNGQTRAYTLEISFISGDANNPIEELLYQGPLDVQWHQVRVDLNFQNLMADVYFDDVLIGDDVTASPKNVRWEYNGLHDIFLGKVGVSHYYGSSAFFDDFSVYGAVADDPQVAVDIKPGSCPNPLNVRSRGVLPVAIVGTADFDVTEVDPDTVFLEGVAPLRWSYEDVATPSEPLSEKESCFDCTDEGPDGILDLTLKFETQEVVAAIGPVTDGECVVLELSGALDDGTVITGEDVVVIKKKGK